MGKAFRSRGREVVCRNRATPRHRELPGWRHLTLEALEFRHMLSMTPVVTLGADASIDEGLQFQRAAEFVDTEGSSWTGTVDYGDGSDIEPLVSFRRLCKIFAAGRR